MIDHNKCAEVNGECFCTASHVDFANSEGLMYLDSSINQYARCEFYQDDGYDRCAFLDCRKREENKMTAYLCSNEEAIIAVRVINRLESI